MIAITPQNSRLEMCLVPGPQPEFKPWNSKMAFFAYRTGFKQDPVSYAITSQEVDLGIRLFIMAIDLYITCKSRYMQ